LRVTIITPSLNQEKYLGQTIDSVINQAGDFELEYIIVDGFSIDNSQNMIKKYDKLINSGKFKPKCKKLIFKWISERELGQSRAINKGFQISTGSILNWICADDLLESGALQKVVNFFKLHLDSQVVFANTKYIDKLNIPIGGLASREFTRKELINRWNFVYVKFSLPQPSTFFRREVLEKVGLINENNRLCMDYEWYLKINKTYKFFFLNKILSSTRVHSFTKSFLYENQQYKDSISISKKYWNENYPYYFLSYYFNLFLRTIYRLSTFFKKKSRLYSNIVKIIKNTSFVLFG
jgi:glycosyltransferase involved in cell wall biosynthesis